MTQNVAAAVLADEVAQVGTKTHVGHGGLVVTPFLDGEALEQNEAFSVNEVKAQGFKVVCQLGKAEVALRYVSLVSGGVPRLRNSP